MDELFLNTFQLIVDKNLYICFKATSSIKSVKITKKYNVSTNIMIISVVSSLKTVSYYHCQ